MRRRCRLAPLAGLLLCAWCALPSAAVDGDIYGTPFREGDVVVVRRESSAASSRSSAFDLGVGPSIGFFFPADSGYALRYGASVLAGMDAALWYGRCGIRMEYGTSRASASSSVDVPGGTRVRRYTCDRELTLSPLWFSVLYRGRARPYGYAGAGVGVVAGRLSTTIGGVSADLTDNLTGMQLLAGLAGETVGLTLKYSIVPAGRAWGGIDLGGFSTTLSIFL